MYGELQNRFIYMALTSTRDRYTKKNNFYHNIADTTFLLLKVPTLHYMSVIDMT